MTPSTSHPTIPRTMQAITQDAYGSTDVLRVAEVPVPACGGDQVLLRVHAAGVDRGTWHTMTGQPYLMRVMGFGLRRPTRRIAGLDVAGTVVAVGDQVTRLAVGDEVYGFALGSFAEYAVAAETKLAAKPAALSFEQAAALPVSGVTALNALHATGRVAAGQRVLVIGASGGVGSYAVQIAKAAGADVTAVCSTGKADLVRSLGADRVIDYTREDFADDAGRYDLVLDIGGNSRLARLRSALAPTGTLVIIGGENGGRWTGGFGRQLRAVALSPFVRQRLTMQVPQEHFSGLERLADLVDAGAVVPSIERSYELAGVAEAVDRIAAGQARGKLVVRVGQRAE
jgi:NADPH:quinone reductase-like Zn-dependent oxidoreductase